VSTAVNEVDDFLEHFGKKGMKWGKRSSSSSSSSPTKTRGELRELNKVARSENKAKAKSDRAKEDKAHDDKVNKARDGFHKDAANLDKAQQKYKADKKVIGKVAAKRALKEAEDKYIDSFNTATLSTTKEAHKQMIAAAGLLTLSAIVSGIAAAN
jgi:hypothetical protein